MIKHFDKEKWAKMTVFEQMGNIGSEVGRTLIAKQKGNKLAMDTAFWRSLDLIDYTAELWSKTKPYRVKELLRAREIFTEAFITGESASDIEKYFFQFALAARRNR